MEHNKLYQYENVARQAPLSYSGTLAVELANAEESKINVFTPVNKAENYAAVKML